MRRYPLTAALFLLAAACAGEPPCTRCDTIVIAATSEPSALLPPLVFETVGRDIGDQIYERLANLAPGGASVDTGAYRPGLAARWEPVDSLTWRFHLRPGARWQDGRPVTARDVVFSFKAYADTLLEMPGGPAVAAITAEVEDSATVLLRFRRSYPEQLYDATWYVRIIPAHIWSTIPAGDWGADTALAHLVGSGPFRLESWQRGQAVTLAADSGGGNPPPRLARAVWRFAADPDAALNLVLSGEADLMEAVGSPERVQRVEDDSTLHAVRYPAAAYGFLGYQLAGSGGGAAVLRDRAVRRALNQAIDRQAIATAVFGPGAVAPPGPYSRLLWIWDDSVTVLPFDTAAAAQAFDAAGWRRGADGLRRRGKAILGFDILVPATSLGRRRLAEALQEQWRLAGVTATVTAVDFPVFQERLGRGRFDSYIGAWLDEPSPRSLADQWTSAGVGQLNYGHYTNPAFDALFSRAAATGSPAEARAGWRAAMDTLNADAPALFLYNPVNVAAVARRVQGLEIDPYSWLSRLSQVSLSARPR